MYVGVTRAEEQLYLTFAKRRLLWGDYKYNPPSRFLEEIPQSLLDTSYSETLTVSKPSFKNTNYTSRTSQFNEDGRIMPTTGFGKNFIAPQKRNYSEGAAEIIKRKTYTKEQTEQQTKEFFKDNAIKRMIEEKKQKEKEAQEEKEREIKEHNTFEIFKTGDRVFHEKLGIGTILEVMEIGESSMYTVDFGKQGKKALDASYAHLKKF